MLTLTDYVAQGTLGAAAALYLGEAVLARRNLVIAGAADSGKTTFANALLAHLLEKHPEERLVVIEEEARELRLEAPNVVRLLTAAGFSARELVRLALRENPSWVILGEARGAECYDWLRAAHTGHAGGLLTLHASSAADVLERLADMIAEAGVEPSPRRIARTVDLIVYLEHEDTIGGSIAEHLAGKDHSQSAARPLIPVDGPAICAIMPRKTITYTHTKSAHATVRVQP